MQPVPDAEDAISIGLALRARHEGSRAPAFTRTRLTAPATRADSLQKLRATRPNQPRQAAVASNCEDGRLCFLTGAEGN